jgi:hypothetical protein
MSTRARERQMWQKDVLRQDAAIEANLRELGYGG